MSDLNQKHPLKKNKNISAQIKVDRKIARLFIWNGAIRCTRADLFLVEAE